MYSTSYKRYVTIVLLVVYVFNQTDRAIFGILMEPMKRELGFSDTQLGFLAGPALALFYATLGIPIARWADRSHRVNIMSAAIALWSCVVLLSAAAGKFWQVAAVRIGVGVGEAGFSAVAQSVLADYHTAKERARAVSIFMLAIPLGGVVSNFMGGWINQSYGWRAAFLAAGLPGFALACVVKASVREPTRTGARSVHTSSRSHSSSTPKTESLKTVLLTMWRRKTLRRLTLAAGLMNLIAVGLLGWAAPFFVRTHGMSTGELGTWLAVSWGLGGGTGIWLSGKLAQLGAADEKAQAHVLAASALLAAVLAATTVLVPSRDIALALLVVVTAVAYVFYAPSFALVQSLSGPRFRATALAVVIFAQLIFGSLVGWQVIGALSDVLAPAYGPLALRWAMLAVTPAGLLAAWCFWRAGQSVRGDLIATAEAGAPADGLDGAPTYV